MRKTTFFSFFGLFLVILFALNTLGSSVKYEVKVDNKYSYQIKYAPYAEDNSDYLEKLNDTVSAFVAIKIVRETVIETNTLSQSAGTIVTNMWYQTSGTDWELFSEDHEYDVNFDTTNESVQALRKENIPLIVDGQVDKTDITNFFKYFSYLVPSGLSATAKSKIGNELELNMYNMFGISVSSIVHPDKSLNYTFTKIGSKNYKVEVIYDETDGALNRFKVSSTTNLNHTVFWVERMLFTVNNLPQPSEIPGYPSVWLLGISLGTASFLLVKKSKKYHQ